MKTIVMTLTLAIGGGAASADAPSTGARCASIAQDADRLACYDELHRPARPVEPAAVPVAGMSPAGRPKGEFRSAQHEGSPVSPQQAARRGALTAAWSTQGVEPFALRPYNPIYLLPVSHTDAVNRRPSSPAPGHDTGIDLPNRADEVKFQLSAKTLLWPGVFGDRGDLWLGYTQSSRWQLYQAEISRPFRETNYEPEVLLNFMLDGDVLGWKLRTAGLSLNHQSNGRALPLSRSWNRVIAHIGLEHDDWSVVLRPWLRLRESNGDDDNPDILDHVGRAELTIRREFASGGGLSATLRHSLRGGATSRGAAELEWAFPLSGRLQGYLQVFSGHGESLIDYNHRQNRIGLGFSLAGWR